MGKLAVEGLGKAYRLYPSQWARLAEWVLPGGPRHKLHWVLRDVSFDVKPGEAVAIIGENGAGKSTLLKLITGTTQPSTGRVAIEGRVSAMLELGMGFHPDFTGRQNVYMAAQLLGMSRAEIDAAMPAIEAFADIGEYIDEPVRIYSSGMQVRLAFSVATVRRPDILIVDEALSVGDARFQRKSFNRIRQFREAGTTLLLVSHDVGAVRLLCDRAIWLHQGVIRAAGQTRDVIEEYAASVYAQTQDLEGAAAAVSAGGASPLPALPPTRDCRQDFINASNLRNDLQVFPFKANAERWGHGAARTLRVTLRDADDRPLAYAIGGEAVQLVIEGEARSDLAGLSVGFEVKDRLGIALFGDNTFLRYADAPVSLRAGERFEARFEFLMPVLPKGHYAVTAALASGNQAEHVMEEWMEEALHFESHNAAAVQGVVGIPMRAVSLGPPL
jgi:lipopolysaccharide transport system ATP-binding protein